jgi:DNA-binding beta-propeller fold protein YncE
MTGGGSNYQRDFAISQGNVSSYVACNIAPTGAPLGEVDGIDVSNSSISSRIALGRCPVYVLETPDFQRVFVLNRGSDTITVINAQTNALDTCTGLVNQSGQPITCHPVLPLSTTAVTQTGVTPPNGTTGMTATAGPVYAEYNAATNQLVVANYDGGTISIIDVSLDQYGNDSATFGTTYTVKVGQTSTPYPASVTVLVDGSRAYTANQADCTPDCTTSANGTVTIVNLSSHTVEKTLAVTGYPRTLVSTQNSSYGKVYVASPNSPYLTIVRTDQDIVGTTVLLKGNTVDVRVTTQDASAGNKNAVSRVPGYGQPCNLPPSVMTSKYGANYTLDQCRNQP